MTEMKTETHTCNMGRATDKPCRFPGVEQEPGRYLCRFHAATEPLVEESDEMNFALDLVKGYIKDASNEGSLVLVDALHRIREDFAERLSLADYVLESLREAERRDMRG